MYKICSIALEPHPMILGLDRYKICSVALEPRPMILGLGTFVSALTMSLDVGAFPCAQALVSFSVFFLYLQSAVLRRKGGHDFLQMNASGLEKNLVSFSPDTVF